MEYHTAMRTVYNRTHISEDRSDNGEDIKWKKTNQKEALLGRSIDTKHDSSETALRGETSGRCHSWAG